jgi:hypothetical protein
MTEMKDQYREGIDGDDTNFLPGNVTPRPLATTHRLTAGMSSAFPPFPSTNNGFAAPGPSHLTVFKASEINNVLWTGDREGKTYPTRSPNF